MRSHRGPGLCSAERVRTHFSLILVITPRALSPATLPLHVTTAASCCFWTMSGSSLPWGFCTCYPLVLECSLLPLPSHPLRLHVIPQGDVLPGEVTSPCGWFSCSTCTPYFFCMAVFIHLVTCCLYVWKLFFLSK